MASSQSSDRNSVPDAYQALRSVGVALEQSTLGLRLIDLIFLRLSQIGGCEYSIETMTQKLLTQGENKDRLESLREWRDSQHFTKRERAALAWTEAVIESGKGHGPDALLDALNVYFSSKEVAELTMTAVLMNAWNKVDVSLKKQNKKSAP